MKKTSGLWKICSSNKPYNWFTANGKFHKFDFKYPRGFSQSKAFNSPGHPCQGPQRQSQGQAPWGHAEADSERKRNHCLRLRNNSDHPFRRRSQGRPSERTPANASPAMQSVSSWSECSDSGGFLCREIALIQVKRRRVQGSRRKPSVVCGIYTQKTGFLGSAQSHTVCKI